MMCSPLGASAGQRSVGQKNSTCGSLDT